MVVGVRLVPSALGRYDLEAAISATSSPIWDQVLVQI